VGHSPGSFPLFGVEYGTDRGNLVRPRHPPTSIRLFHSSVVSGKCCDPPLYYTSFVFWCSWSESFPAPRQVSHSLQALPDRFHSRWILSIRSIHITTQRAEINLYHPTNRIILNHSNCKSILSFLRIGRVSGECCALHSTE